MERQCVEVGAAGVIGVHLDLRGTESDGLATFVASGTAVRAIDRVYTDAPVFTSSLSGRDFHLLARNGSTPVGFVVGTSVVHFGWRSLNRWAASQGKCREMVSLTQSLYAARETAIRRLGEQALSLHADGVIDVKVIERPDVWGSHVIEFVAYGTAIKVGRPSPAPFDPEVLVMLNDPEAGRAPTRADTFGRALGNS
jgi:uncharacterized protein YbjQ (UPF0145 family)